MKIQPPFPRQSADAFSKQILNEYPWLDRHIDTVLSHFLGAGILHYDADAFYEKLKAILPDDPLIFQHLEIRYRLLGEVSVKLAGLTAPVIVLHHLYFTAYSSKEQNYMSKDIFYAAEYVSKEGVVGVRRYTRELATFGGFKIVEDKSSMHASLDWLPTDALIGILNTINDKRT